jgi:hypothetical protein
MFSKSLMFLDCMVRNTDESGCTYGIQIVAFCVVMPEHGGSKLLRNAGILPPSLQSVTVQKTAT